MKWVLIDGGWIRTEKGVPHMLSAVLIATCLAVAMPCFAQQVRVINGDFEHVYVRAASHASITRSIAGCFRFLILIQCFDRPA